MAGRVSKWRPPDTYIRRRRFAGYDDEFLDWSWDMAYYFSQRDYDEDKQFNVAISCFTGYARTWWNQFEDDRWYRRRPPVKTWAQLVFVMTRHFAPEIDARGYTKTIQHRSGPRPLVPTESYTVRSSHPLERRPKRSPVRVTRSHPSVPASQVMLAHVPPIVLMTATEPTCDVLESPNSLTLPTFDSSTVFDEYLEEDASEIPSTPTRSANESPPIFDEYPEGELLDVPVLIESVSSDVCDGIDIPVLVSTALHEPEASPIPPSEVTIIAATPSKQEKTASAPEPFMLHFVVPRVGHVPYTDAALSLASSHLFLLAPTCSKRGRFDSKGGRMMWSCPAIRRSIESPRRPRPWRPPWTSI